MTNNITTTVLLSPSHLVLSSCPSSLLFVSSLQFYSACFNRALETHADILDLAVSTLHYAPWLVRLAVRPPKFSRLPYPSAAAQENPTPVDQGTCQPVGPANQYRLTLIPFSIRLD